jgi:hypothetical protein
MDSRLAPRERSRGIPKRSETFAAASEGPAGGLGESRRDLVMLPGASGMFPERSREGVVYPPRAYPLQKLSATGYMALSFTAPKPEFTKTAR